MSDALWPHELQHARLPCPSLSPGVCSTHVHWIADAIQPSNLCRSLLLLFSVFPSIRVSSTELALCIRWPKYWSINFSVSPSSEYSGLISFRIDWFDLLAVQGTLKSFLQHHSLKASILWCSAFFMVNSLISTLLLKKTISLTIGPLLAKWCLCFLNMLSRFVIAFLPRSKHLFISWLQSLSAVILEPKKIKSVTVSTVFHLFALKWWDWMPGPIIMPF